MTSFLIVRLPSHVKSLEAVEYMQRNHFSFRISSNSSLLKLLNSLEGTEGGFAATLEILDEFKLGDEEKHLINQFAAVEVKEEVESDVDHQPKDNDDATEVKEEVESDVEQDDFEIREARCSHETGASFSQPQSPLVCVSQIQQAVIPSTLDEQGVQHGESREMAVDDLLEPADADDSMMSIDVFDASLDEEDLLEEETVQSTNSIESVVKEENDISESVLETSQVAVQTSERVEAPTDETQHVDDEDIEDNENMEDFGEDEEDLVEEQEHERKEDCDEEEDEDSTDDAGVSSDEECDDAQEVIMKKKNGQPSGRPVARLLFTCIAKNCPSSYKKFKKLEEHMEIHRDEQDFYCDVCKKIFSSKEDAMTHIRRRLDKECCGCGKKLPLPNRLLRHLRSHTGEKPFVCQTCGRGFNHVGHFKNHMMTHTGEKPYSCGYCKKRFSQRIHLTTHELTHTGERPFECSHCGRTFNRRSALNSHIRLHTGEKPYSCKECDKKFSRNDHLKKHMKKIHKL